MDKTVVRYDDGVNWGNLQHSLREAQGAVPIEIHIKDETYVMDKVCKNFSVIMEREPDKFHTVSKIIFRIE